jgi:hypothetical protein
MLLRTKKRGGGRKEIYLKLKSNKGSLNQLLPGTPGLSCFSGGHTASRPLFSIYTLIHLTPGVGPQIPYPPDNNGDHIFLSH